VTHLLGGGSDGAGFVQVMKNTGLDRDRAEQLDEALTPIVDQRGDVLGGLRIWTGADTCTEVIYFTSEAEARQGEKLEMPEEVATAMAQAMDGVEVEYLDLTDPLVH